MSGTTTASYLYDANLKRVKTVAGGATTYSAYSRVTGGLIFRDELASATLTDYVSAGGASLRLKRQQQTTTPEYIHADALGSPVAATNAGGTVTWRESYTPFGDIRLAPPANDNSTGFTGHLRDKNTSLVYMQARLYDPTIGRFLSTDPIGYQDQLNLYAYVANDPVNKTDPTGESAISIAVKIALKGGDVASALKGVADDVATLANPAASGIDKAIAVVSLASEALSPVSLKDAKAIGNAVESAADRAKSIQKAAGDARQGRTTTAVVETKEGTRVVGSSEPNLRPAQQDALAGGEVAAKGPGHAEVTAVNAAKEMGLTPTGVAASRPICSECAAFLQKEGVQPLTPLKDELK